MKNVGQSEPGGGKFFTSHSFVNNDGTRLRFVRSQMYLGRARPV